MLRIFGQWCEYTSINCIWIEFNLIETYLWADKLQFSSFGRWNALQWWYPTTGRTDFVSMPRPRISSFIGQCWFLPISSWGTGMCKWRWGCMRVKNIFLNRTRNIVWSSALLMIVHIHWKRMTAATSRNWL